MHISLYSIPNQKYVEMFWCWQSRLNLEWYSATIKLSHSLHILFFLFMHTPTSLVVSQTLSASVLSQTTFTVYRCRAIVLALVSDLLRNSWEWADLSVIRLVWTFFICMYMRLESRLSVWKHRDCSVAAQGHWRQRYALCDAVCGCMWVSM